MGVPRGRRTKSKQGHRRSHLALKVLRLASCAKCGAKKMPHTVCSGCGFYKGRLAVDVMAKLSKKERKEKEKQSRVKK